MATPKNNRPGRPPSPLCLKCGSNDWYIRGVGGRACAPCKRASAAKYRREHRGEIAALRQANTENARQYMAKWRPEHRARLRALSVRWHRAHPARVRELGARRYRANVEAHRVRNAKYQKENAGRLRLVAAAWRETHPETLRATRQRRRTRQMLAPGRGVTLEQWQGVLEASLGICAYCNRQRPLTMEHIDPLSRGGKHDIENIAAICKSCNASKGTASFLVWLCRSGMLRRAG